MKVFYLSKSELIEGVTNVLYSANTELSKETADNRFGEDQYVVYKADRLPYKLKYIESTNTVEVLPENSPENMKHLYVGIGALSNVVTKDMFDPSQFVGNNSDSAANFPQTINANGVPSLSYPHASYFTTYKSDGTAIDGILKATDDRTVQILPNTVDGYIGKNLVVNGDITSRGNVYATSDFVLTAGGKQVGLKSIVNRLKVLEDAIKNLGDTTPVGVIASFPNEGVVPPGWQLCDGQTVPVNQFTEEYRRKVGTTTPDMRGYFTKGWDKGSGRGGSNGQEGSVGSVTISAYGAKPSAYKVATVSAGGSDDSGGTWNVYNDVLKGDTNVILDRVVLVSGSKYEQHGYITWNGTGWHEFSYGGMDLPSLTADKNPILSIPDSANYWTGYFIGHYANGNPVPHRGTYNKRLTGNQNPQPIVVSKDYVAVTYDIPYFNVVYAIKTHNTKAQLTASDIYDILLGGL